jgi:hypothetical protein
MSFKALPSELPLPVTLLTCIQEVLGSNTSRTLTILTEVLRGFPQSFQANFWTML